jgi:hypothetical protein
VAIMADVLIRDVDPAMHAELRRRAESAGLSMQSYITRLLAEHVQRPTMEQWLARLDSVEAVEEVRGAEVVAAAREELP